MARAAAISAIRSKAAGAQVMEIREMNPGFNGIHPEPIAKHLKPLMELTPARSSPGAGNDGDGDRIGAVGPTGRFIDPRTASHDAGAALLWSRSAA